MSGKMILYIIVLLYIASMIARCDLASSISASNGRPTESHRNGIT